MITYTITKWCASATKDRQEHLTKSEGSCEEIIEFRLLDKDGNEYCYGKMNRPTAKPLIELQYLGCDSMDFMTKDTKVWKHYMGVGDDLK